MKTAACFVTEAVAAKCKGCGIIPEKVHATKRNGDFEFYCPRCCIECGQTAQEENAQ